MPAPIQSDDVLLLHLSDIHFNKETVTSRFDPDEDLRNEFILDVEKQVNDLCHQVDGILVSGDVAYRGAKAEYDLADKFLVLLRERSGCSPDNIFICPGNHDIDRTIAASPLIEGAHTALRGLDRPGSGVAWNEHDKYVQRWIDDKFTCRTIYTPSDAYNDFAEKHDSSFSPLVTDNDGSCRYCWDRKIPLNDGSFLCIRGISTVVTSGSLEENEKGELFVGARATTLLRKAGTEYLTMCHHPPSWLMDGSTVRDRLNDRARIQLFGHEHDQRIDAGAETIRLYAGAIHPNRNEPGWKPGYNLIWVRVDGTGDKRTMRVNVRAQDYQLRPTLFRSILNRSMSDVHSFCVKLDSWTSPLEAAQRGESQEERIELVPPERQELEAGPPALDPREITRSFFALPLSRKIEILGKLGLVEESDASLPDFARYKRALQRAAEQGKLHDLWALIQGD